MSNNVYQMIAAVSADLCKEGISKDRKNQQQGYNFRGIDDVYNALAPIMSKHGLVVLPRCLSRESIERQNRSGGTLFYVVVECEFDFVSSHDKSHHIVKTYGEAMDSGDKATNKAMSAAYKYACMQAFCIPTEGDNDADSTTHDLASKTPPRGGVISAPQQPAPEPKLEPKPQEVVKGTAEVVDFAMQIFTTFLPEAKSEKELNTFWKENIATVNQIKSADETKYVELLGAFKKRKDEINKPKGQDNGN